MSVGQEELFSRGKWLRSASAHIGLEEQCLVLDIFSLLGRKRQKEAASAGLKVKGTRARLEVTAFSEASVPVQVRRGMLYLMTTLFSLGI